MYVILVLLASLISLRRRTVWTGALKPMAVRLRCQCRRPVFRSRQDHRQVRRHGQSHRPHRRKFISTNRHLLRMGWLRRRGTEAYGDFQRRNLGFESPVCRRPLAADVAVFLSVGAATPPMAVILFLTVNGRYRRAYINVSIWRGDRRLSGRETDCHDTCQQSCGRN
jgi:hypothetical protein